MTESTDFEGIATAAMRDELPAGYPGTPEPAAGTPLREVAGSDEDAAPVDRVKLPGHLVRIFLEVPGSEELAVFEVRVDNRDYVRWDKTAPRRNWTGTSHPFIFQSFVGWSAAERKGHTRLNFDQFLELAVEVQDLKDEDARPTR